MSFFDEMKVPKLTELQEYTYGDKLTMIATGQVPNEETGELEDGPVVSKLNEIATAAGEVKSEVEKKMEVFSFILRNINDIYSVTATYDAIETQWKNGNRVEAVYNPANGSRAVYGLQGFTTAIAASVDDASNPKAVFACIDATGQCPGDSAGIPYFTVAKDGTVEVGTMELGGGGATYTATAPIAISDANVVSLDLPVYPGTAVTRGTRGVQTAYTEGRTRDKFSTSINVASGVYAHAEGYSTEASDDSSHAEGNGTTASGSYSHAEGHSTTANKDSSHAEGSGTTASGSYSHAEGNGTTASGGYSHAEGYSTEASNDSSHAEGNGTTASGSYSHAEGHSTTANKDSSHAEGYSTEASGSYSHAEGNGTTASGGYSHAEGGSTEASSSYSHAEGGDTKARGDSSHAEGRGTTASGGYSHAEGGSTTASGGSSHAEGLSTIASGGSSHAEGLSTIAQRKSQHVFGECNIADTEGTTTTRGTYVEIVGNGTSDAARSNARTLAWDGTQWNAGDVTCATEAGSSSNYSLRAIGAVTASVPSMEYGTSNSIQTISSSSTVNVDITFGSAKTEAPVVFTSLQCPSQGVQLVCTVQSVTNTQASLSITNLGTVDVQNVTVDWLALSGR